MRKVLYAAMLVAMGGYMAPASAVTTNIGDLLLQPNYTYNLFNSFSSSTGSFSDLYTFDLSQPSQSLGTTVTFQISLLGNSSALGNMAIQLTDASMNVLGTDTQALSGNTLIISVPLPADTGYGFWVTGDVTGTIGGSYSGLLTAVPVPEAETYAMMLVGLGLVGFMVRRRSRLLA